MKSNFLNNSYVGNSYGIGAVETKESRALNINLIRTREPNRSRRKKIEWFSFK